MKSTWFSRPQHHDFARCLEAASHGSRSMWETFSDFLTLAAILAAKQNATAGIELISDRVARLRNDLTQAEAELQQCETELRTLEQTYPAP